MTKIIKLALFISCSTGREGFYKKKGDLMHDRKRGGRRTEASRRSVSSGGRDHRFVSHVRMRDVAPEEEGSLRAEQGEKARCVRESARASQLPFSRFPRDYRPRTVT